MGCGWDKKKINHLLLALSYIAKSTGRAIRVEMEIQKGYNSEHVQPYSVVDAFALHELGIEVVEPGYWLRARSRQHHDKKEQVVELDDDGDLLQSLDAALKDQNWEEADELVFQQKQLLKIPEETLKTKLGSVTKPLACMTTHPNPKRVSTSNDQLSKLW